MILKKNPKLITVTIILVLIIIFIIYFSCFNSKQNETITSWNKLPKKVQNGFNEILKDTSSRFINYKNLDYNNNNFQKTKLFSNRFKFENNGHELTANLTLTSLRIVIVSNDTLYLPLSNDMIYKKQGNSLEKTIRLDTIPILKIWN